MRNFYGIDLADPPSEAPTAEVLETFEHLKPRASGTPLIRIGADIDGSYLVPDDLEGIAACFSPGVNRIKYFEDFLTEHYGIASHMCDFSCDVEQFKTPLKAEMQTFTKKWLDVDLGADNITLEEWIAVHNPEGDLLLQMDIEGAEFRNILATSDATLARFRVIVLEVHGLSKMLDASILRAVFAPFFDKLARSFSVVHAHPNNCCGEFTVPGIDIRIPNVLELTLVRNDHFAPSPGVAALPHPLDVRRNVPRNAPLFLSDAWCDYQRPLESRVQILEDQQSYRDDVGSSGTDAELSAALSLTMQALQTLSSFAAPMPKGDSELVEVARGRPYRLSSAYGTSSRTGVVEPRGSYFFHTAFGQSQYIRVDLGRRHGVRRIVVTNRRDGFRMRAKHMFVVLTGGRSGSVVTDVFPMYETGELPGGEWEECAIDLPDVQARYVTITSPLNTALHFSDLRIYAGDRDATDRPRERTSKVPVWRALRTVTGLTRRLSPRA